MEYPLTASMRYKRLIGIVTIAALSLVAGAGCTTNTSLEVFESAATAIEDGDAEALRMVLDQRVHASDAEMMSALDDEARSALAQALRKAVFVQDKGNVSEYVVHVDDGNRPPTDVSVYLVVIDGEKKLRFVQ